MSEFIHLRVYSDYSIGLGALKTKALLKLCTSKKIPAVALTDKNNLFGALEFSLEAAKNGVQPIIGLALNTKGEEKNYSEVLLIAQNEEGFKNLLKLSSNAYLNRLDNKCVGVPLQDIYDNNSGLIMLIGGVDSHQHNLFKENKLDEISKSVKQTQGVFGDRLYIEIQRGKATSNEYEELMLDIAYKQNIAIVATNPVCFLEPEMYEAHDAFICIANGRYLLDDTRPKSSPESYFKSAKEMEALYADLPEAIANTKVIAQRCSVMAESRAPLLPRFSANEIEEIAAQSRAGLEKRIIDIKDESQRKVYFDRLTFELSVINGMQYAGYFLIVSDFIKWSKANDIPVGPGRGSGAGSVVAWALEITDLDPLQYGLLFERFLNPDRVSLPDFDIDFCQDRRGEVIDYVRKKYGNDRVAQIITFGKLQARAVLRDVGRVLQLPYLAVDKICKMVPNNPANPITLKEAIALDKDLQQQAQDDPSIEKLLKISLQLEGLNRHASTHAAGLVIADRSIVELVPLYQDDNAELPAVQYSMKYAEEAGLIKFDFLGLKTLTMISWACKLIITDGAKLDIAKVPIEDTKTYELLSRGETIGVFQFESTGMKEAIKKLKPDRIEDLIALGSLYRPGPMDNIPSYINRKHGLEKPEYIHPLMETVLKETYGIIVYQEQVIEIARVMAGYTLGSADLLRRAMGKKIKEEMEAQREVFLSGCARNGIEAETARELFALIEKFASYGFNKSHAAAYALISYQTAYLKANYPLEFLIASMNLEIHDTDKINLFCQEAKRLNIELLPPDVNFSQSTFCSENGKIRFALGALKNVGIQPVQALVDERNQRGLFKDIFSLLERCGSGLLNKRMLESLSKAGAFDGIYKNRHELLENAELLIKFANNAAKNKNTQQLGLFGQDSELDTTRPKLITYEEWDFQEMLGAEFGAFGFYLASHPLESYAAKLAKLPLTDSVNVEARATFKGAKLNVAGVIISKKIRSSKKGKYAFLQLSDRSGLLEFSVFNEQLLYKHEDLLQPGSIVYLKVDVRKDDNGLRTVVDEIQDIEFALSHVKTVLEIVITSPESIPQVQSCLSDDGKIVQLKLQLPTGEEVIFGSKKQMFINHKGEAQLKKISGVTFCEL